MMQINKLNYTGAKKSPEIPNLIKMIWMGKSG